jgi:CRISPR-associated endonuclease/helicase Cas3
MNVEASELARHMVAAHHGRARPHFPDSEAFDPKYPDATSVSAADEVPERYLRLQKIYGRWGLAYLESLLRIVDAWASQEEMALEANA